MRFTAPDPQRELRVATRDQLQALAHPVRMRLIAALRRGPATATQLADELGESSGSTSYHLRVLGKAGVIEEDLTRRRGRERWWRRPEGALVVPTGSDDPDTRAAEARLRAYFVDQDDAALRQFVEADEALPQEWRNAAFIGSWTLWITPEESEELGHRVLELIGPFLERAERPADARKLLATFRSLPYASSSPSKLESIE